MKKGDLVKLEFPHDGSTVRLTGYGSGEGFVVRHGHLGILLDIIEPMPGDRYAEVYFQKRGKIGTINVNLLRLASDNGTHRTAKTS